MGMMNDPSIRNPEDNIETEESRESPPVWNLKSAAATIVLFFFGFGILLFLQAWLLSSRYGDALLELGENTAITGTVVILTYVGLTVVGVGSIWLVVIVLGKRSWRELGFRPLVQKWLNISIWLAAILVVVRVVIGAFLALRFPSLTEGVEDLLFTPDNDMLTNLEMLVLIGVLVPVWEELFFRGFLYKWFRNYWGVWPSIVLSALLFGVFHIIPLQILLAAIMGVALAWIYERSNTLWAPILMHAVNNLIVGVFAILLLLLDSAL